LLVFRAYNASKCHLAVDNYFDDEINVCKDHDDLCRDPFLRREKLGLTLLRFKLWEILPVWGSSTQKIKTNHFKP